MHLETELTKYQERRKSFKNKNSHPLGSHGGWEVTSCQKLSSPRQNKLDMCEVLCMELNKSTSKKKGERFKVAPSSLKVHGPIFNQFVKKSCH